MSFFSKLFGKKEKETLDEGLNKTKEGFFSKITKAIAGKSTVDAEVLDSLEEALVNADVGIDTTKCLLEQLTATMSRGQLADGEALFLALKTRMQAMLEPVARPLSLITDNNMPFVILMVGVNGAGKTTTIGKLAKQYQQQGKSVMLAAGDTFRSAAVEQLKVWGERNQIAVVAQHTGADSASVIFDALHAAKARGVDILIADTAGRLHTQHNLMDELKKIKRVMQKLDSNAPHEIMLVLDAGLGQNALNQARQFNQAVGLTGITMTKLDGTAKGGILFSIANELEMPVRYLGVGEGVDDLQPFDAAEFINAIFNHDHI